MDYTPLIPYFQNCLLTFAIIFAVTSVVGYVIMRNTNTSFLNEQTPSLVVSTILAIFLGVIGLFVFTYNLNDQTNQRIVKSNIEAKYDVVISNVQGVRQDKTASLYKATIVSNKDQKAYNISLLIANDGTPSIINENGFNAEMVAR